MSAPAVIVVIPVHDEAELLGACLRSVGEATAVAVAAHPGLRVATWVVLDACTDASARVARRYPVRTLAVDALRVGDARAAGIRAALAEVADAEPADVWIANTDGDSIVPANWIAHQLDLAREGVDLVIGTVRPDFADLSARHVAAWRATHSRGRPNGHVHGANLGVRASTYLAAGGFPAVAEHEDVRLVENARAAGAVVRACDVGEVVTSGRFTGRTPGGYAAYLREQHRDLEHEDDLTA